MKKTPVSSWIKTVAALLETGDYTAIRVQSWDPEGDPDAFTELPNDLAPLMKEPRPPGDYALLDSEGKLISWCSIPAEGDEGSRNKAKRNRFGDRDALATAAPGEASLGRQARDLAAAQNDHNSALFQQLQMQFLMVNQLREQLDEVKDENRELKAQLAIAASGNDNFLVTAGPYINKIFELIEDKNVREKAADLFGRILQRLPADKAIELEPHLNHALNAKEAS